MQITVKSWKVLYPFLSLNGLMKHSAMPSCCPQYLTEMYSCMGTGEGCFIMPVLSLNTVLTEK